MIQRQQKDDLSTIFTENGGSGGISKMSLKDVGDLLSSKMNNMSLQERSSALHELHGVADLQEEKAEMIQAKLEEMNQALSYIKNDATTASAQAYKKAVSVSPEYVEKLKIPCLRAKEYNSQEAADHLVRFFGRKMELFGEENLAQDITREDLTSEEQEALKKGIFQLLPHRDRAGRAVLFVHGELSVLYETRSVVRLLLYIAMAALQDEETQRRGLVLIYYAIGQKNKVKGRIAEYWKNWVSTIWRIVAFHYCYDNESNGVLPSVFGFCKFLENRAACRWRMHGGMPMECIYNLMTFGIPKDALPMDIDGMMDLSSHRSMLQVIWHRERQIKSKTSTSPSSGSDGKSNEENSTDASTESSEMSTILVPGPMDILMGRGRKPKGRPGVLRFHNLLEENMEIYDNTSKNKKAAIVDKILIDLKKSGCRFLIGDSDGYKECSDYVAKEKISHGFRNLRLKSSARSSANVRHAISENEITMVERDEEKRKRPSEMDYENSPKKLEMVHEVSLDEDIDHRYIICSLSQARHHDLPNPFGAIQ